MPERQYQGLSVPGNLLLAGEFAVLTKGGLGLTCAVDRRVTCSWQAHDRLEVHTCFAGQQKQWTPGDSTTLSLLERVYRTVIQNGMSLPPVRVAIDSSALYHDDGRKAGLGSSAAVTVAWAAALLYLTTNSLPTADAVFALALEAHRQAQAGRGSGYDVACSTYGGVGLLTGGAQPTLTHLSPAYPMSFYLKSAPQPIYTTSALVQWENWQHRFRDDWLAFRHRSQEVVKRLAQAETSDVFAFTMRSAAALGEALNRHLGVWNTDNHYVTADLRHAPFVKALGAGNELYAVGCAPNDPQRIPVATEGLRWC
ncbi:mevalonate kinase [Planctomycetota bacterium]